MKNRGSLRAPRYGRLEVTEVVNNRSLTDLGSLESQGGLHGGLTGYTVDIHTREGIGKVRAKNRAWAESGERHRFQVDGPFLGEKQFCVRFEMDVTPKATGKRVRAVEMALYTVEDGKIVREEFYYCPAAPS